jgi:hypothetical protein
MDQCWADLLAAIARQAVIDYHADYHHPGVPDAKKFLEAAGLLEQAQTNGPVRRAQRNRRSTHNDSRTLEARPAPGGR